MSCPSLSTMKIWAKSNFRPFREIKNLSNFYRQALLSLKVKWGYISGQKLESERSKSFAVSFHCKPRQSGVSLESPKLENIPEVPANRAEVGQNHDAPKAVSATLGVLKWSEAIFRLRSSKVSVQKLALCPFHCKPRPSGVRLECPGMKNIPQVPRNGAEIGQNHDARKAGSATLLVLK